MKVMKAILGTFLMVFALYTTLANGEGETEFGPGSGPGERLPKGQECPQGYLNYKNQVTNACGGIMNIFQCKNKEYDTYSDNCVCKYRLDCQRKNAAQFIRLTTCAWFSSPLDCKPNPTPQVPYEACDCVRRPKSEREQCDDVGGTYGHSLYNDPAEELDDNNGVCFHGGFER